MNYLSRKVLYINLSKRSFEVKTYLDLHKFLGGLALGLKLVEMNRENFPLVFSIGPLNALFPFVSKTCILDYSKGLQEFYLGGALSSRMRFAGFDAIVFTGVSAEPVFLEINPTEVLFISSREDFFERGLPGRSSRLSFRETLLLDDYFQVAEPKQAKGSLREHFFVKRNIGGLVINGTVSSDIENVSHYGKLYMDILGKTDRLTVLPGKNPSCVGCPMGCEKSQVGEAEGNVLVHSLVACQFAADIYSDLGVVFSCLNALGYDYVHEELESIPSLVKNLMRELKST